MSLSSLHETQQSRHAFVTHDAAFDRRRPGRVEEVNEHLLPLLRADGRLVDADLDQKPVRDDLGPVRGLLLAFAASGIMWCGLYRLVF